MRCARINQLRKRKLFHAPQTLKRWRLYEPPAHLLESACVEFDQVVNRIPNTLWARQLETT
jgi:hypothetical protein